MASLAHWVLHYPKGENGTLFASSFSLLLFGEEVNRFALLCHTFLAVAIWYLNRVQSNEYSPISGQGPRKLGTQSSPWLVYQDL